ncbi:MAG TPA: pentapeptide repeat-containing protein [Candidatus Obscuribacterales bacterium]
MRWLFGNCWEHRSERAIASFIRKIIRFLLPCVLLLGLLWPQPSWAAIAPPERTLLTLDLLQERLRSPAQSEGIRTIDLRRFDIDLRPENANFRDQFYRLLQTQLQRAGSPLGLDLSYSVVQGEFAGNQLGLRAPMYGQALSPIFTSAEQEQLRRDRRRLSRLSELSRSLINTPNVGTQALAPLQIAVFRGPLKLAQTRFVGAANFSNTFFLSRVETQGTWFAQEADWSGTRFSQPSSFAGTIFNQEARFRSSIFFERAGFNQAQFQGLVNFQGSEFQGTANFSQALFRQFANFSRVQWQGNADLAQTHWQEAAQFNKSRFMQSCFLTEAEFEQPLSFREVQFSRPVNLRGASILAQVDFSDASFSKAAYLNVPGLKFDADHAKFLGNPGQIGRSLSVPVLQGNESLLRNLVRNFRQLEQISDANQIEYKTESLRLQELRQRLLGTNINTASMPRLVKIGFSAAQAEAIAQRRVEQPFRSLTELLTLDSIDLADYIKIRDRAIAADSRNFVGWVLDGLHWLSLSLLLLLSRYGTNFWLVFGVEIVAIAYFGVLFWLIDRLRRLRPKPIVPTLYETIAVLSSFSVLSLGGLVTIFQTSDRPRLTLACLAVVIVPVPLLLLGRLYQQGRYHNLMDVSYFVEEGSLRQLRLLIGRMPIMPRFPLFQERYVPLLWDRRWNWLNYYDFSFNNLLRFGFNDIRLRDRDMPGLITALVWYQWSLGILFIALLLWTLSRTIPGLNLLIYFK